MFWLICLYLLAGDLLWHESQVLRQASFNVVSDICALLDGFFFFFFVLFCFFVFFFETNISFLHFLCYTSFLREYPGKLCYDNICSCSFIFLQPISGRFNQKKTFLQGISKQQRPKSTLRKHAHSNILIILPSKLKVFR